MKSKLLQDLSILFISLTLIGLASRILLFPTLSYISINLTFGLFLLPGWFVSLIYLEKRGIVFRFWMAAVISFVVYALCVGVCFVAGLSFDVFYALYGLCVLLSFWWVRSHYQDYQLTELLYGLDKVKWVVLILVGVLALYLFRYPLSIDLDLWTFETLDYLANRNFNVSQLGLTQLGLQEAHPRWTSHFFHAFFALLSDLSGRDVISIVYYLAPPFLGLLMLGSYYYFVSSVVGDKKYNYLIIPFILLCPITLFYAYSDTNQFYDYSFLILNSPALDKCFAQVFILGALLYLSVQFLKSKDKKYLTLLYLSAPMILYFHPLICVYYFMSVFVLSLSFLKGNKKNLLYIQLFSLALLAFFFFVKPQANYHQAIDNLVSYTMDLPKPFFWSGHEASFKSTDTILWVGDIKVLNPDLLWQDNTMIRVTLLATFFWMALLCYRYSLKRETISENERLGFRMQLSYILALAVIFASVPYLLSIKPHLFRGLERLHWVYLGFFSLYYVAEFVVQKLGGVKAWFKYVPLTLIAVHFLVTILALASHHPMTVTQNPFVDSFHKIPPKHSRMLPTTIWFNLTHDKFDSHSLFKKPAWLGENDKVYMQKDQCYFMSLPHCYKIKRQSVFYHELYHLAYAYKKLGPPFLDEFRGFYDGYYGQVSEKLVALLNTRKPTILISDEKEFAEKIDQRTRFNLNAIDRMGNYIVYRMTEKNE